MLTRLFDEIGGRPLGLARVIVGSAAMLRLWAAIPELVALTDPDVLRIPYGQLSLEATTPLVWAISALWGGSAVLFMLGWRIPVTGTALVVAISASLLIDQQTYANHLYLMAWLVLLLTIAGAGSAVNLHRNDSPVVRWPVLLLMAQLSIVYGFSAITKLNGTFLSGSVLAGYLGTGVLPFPETWRTPGFLGPVAALALFVELFIAVFIWRDRFRPAAFVLGFGLHLSIVILMADTLKLVVFALEMLALYPLFLPDRRLAVSWSTSSRDDGLMRSLQRVDVLDAIAPDSSPTTMELTAREAPDVVATGFDAVERILERTVPTLWVAPVLRLPGIRGMGRLWYRRTRSRQLPVRG